MVSGDSIKTVFETYAVFELGSGSNRREGASQLNTTSVTSHSNRSKLSLAWLVLIA